MTIYGWGTLGLIGPALWWLTSGWRRGNHTKRLNGTAPASRNSQGTSKDQSVRDRLPPIPAGFQIYASRLPVAGLHLRKDEARRFIRSATHQLEFVPEPHNPVDLNAIKVIGIGDSKRYFLGYVPTAEAEQIVNGGLVGVVQPRLENAYESRNGFVEVVFQIIGPKTQKQQFDDVLLAMPATAEQKEFYTFFSLPVSYGLTIGQAAQTVSQYQKRLEQENPSQLADWRSYLAICEAVDDEAFGITYGVKKIRKRLLKQALEALKADGISLKEIEDDIQVLVDKVVELRPEMERNER